MKPDEFDMAFQGKIWHRNVPVAPRSILDCGDGWLQIIHDAFQDMLALGWDGCVEQVKEKFGTLRIYIHYSPCGFCEDVGVITTLGNREVKCPECRGINMVAVKARIERAVAASEKTCETCGAHGKLIADRGWIRTLCPSCLIRSSERYHPGVSKWDKT